MYEFNKNAVITGCVSSFCLTCDEFLTSRQDADVHVNTSGHQTSLAKEKFADKFKDDHIWKFKWGYFCQFCNILLPTAAKVAVHITEDRHKHNKLNILSTVNECGVTISNVHVDELSWHGLSEDICFVCNIEIDDESEHKKERKHCLNLVLRPVKIGEKDFVYREVDESTIQCLTCNILLTPDKKTTHFETEEHINTYNKCLIKNKPIMNKTQSDNVAEVPKVNTNKTDSKAKILDSISKYQKDSIQINLERDTAYCKKCLIVVEFDSVVIEQHIKEHSQNTNVQSELQYPSKPDKNLNKTDINEVTKLNTKKSENNNNVESASASTVNNLESNESDKFEFAKANQITCSEVNNTAFCNTCEVSVPSNLSSMKEHVKGMPHTKKVAKVKVHDNKTKIKKQNFEDFVKRAWQIELANNDVETVVNEKYCMTQSSYFMIRRNGFRKRCMLCLVDLPAYESETDHFTRNSHEAMLSTRVFVITSLESEFIREIRSDEYHCGYCNLVVMSWSDLEKHFQCSEHKRNKILFSTKLRNHIPTIRRHELEKRAEMITFLHMMRMMANPFRF